jgi:hypothetical protein
LSKIHYMKMSRGGGVFRFQEGRTWEAMNVGLTDLAIRTLAAGKEGILYAGTDSGEIFRWENRKSWQAIGGRLLDIGLKSLAVSDEGTLYVLGVHQQRQGKDHNPRIAQVYTLSADGVWHTWSPLGWPLSQPPLNLGNTADRALLWARSDRQLWLSRDGEIWLPLAKLPSNAPRLQTIQVRDDQVRFYGQDYNTLVAATMYQGKMSQPFILRLPSAYLTLVAAGWEIVSWVGENPLPAAAIALLPGLLLMVVTYNTMHATRTSFPVALRLVLIGQFGKVSLDEQWPSIERDVRDALRRQGAIDRHTSLDIPPPLRLQALERYFKLYRQQEELIFRSDSLRLTSAARTQAWLAAWVHLVSILAEIGEPPALTELASLVEPLTKALGLHPLEARSLGGLHAIVVSAPPLRLKIPSRFPLVYVEPLAVQPGVDEALLDLNQVLDLTEFFSLIIPFEAPGSRDTNALQLKNLLRPSPYAHDFIVLSHEDILTMLSACDPAAHLVACILEQVDLTVVSPFVTSGPVPERMFFGRDHEIRTITQALPGADFALIGNRRVGKTSLLVRVERILRRSEECLPLPLNFQVVRDDSTLFDLLTQETGFAVADADPRAFSGFVAHLRQQHPDRRMPVLLIDEVDDLLAFDADRGYPLSNGWRMLSFNKDCGFVFAGSRVLTRAMRDADSPFFNFPREIRVGFLQPDTARAMVSGPMDELGIELEPRQEFLDRILYLSSCHPNLVQFICAGLIRQISARGERRIDLDNLAEVEAGGEFANYYLETLWGQTNSLERAITILGNPAGFTMPDVETALAEHGFKASRRAVKEALDMLTIYSVLRRRGRTYTFAPASFPHILRGTQEVDFLLHEARHRWVETVRGRGH